MEARMEVIIERCCGLDVHQETVVACVLIGAPGERPRKEIRTFRTMTRDLEALRDWLQELGVTQVGMESTGVYWRPVYAVLEGHFDLIVGNARHIRNVPGRKTDVKDAEWIADLVRHGLIAKSFVPPAPQRELRELLRYRRKLVESQAAERNRLLKLLETANIKLASVASDVFGVSGRAMLKALIEGSASPEVMADLARGQLRRKRDDLVLALEGRVEEHHRFLLATQLRRLEAAEHDIAALDNRIKAKLAPYCVQHALLRRCCTDHGSRISDVGLGGIGCTPCSDPDPAMPFKANAARRRHIPRQKRRVTNWAAYDASLRQRGSLTVWFTDEAIAAWQVAPRTTRGGQPWYSPLAILTALTLRAVFRLALRQTEGLIGSINSLLGLTLAVPDHSTLSRRAATLEVPQPRSSTSISAEPVHLLVDSTGLKLCGAGEWLVEKHGAKTRRSWRKLHIGMDANTGAIVASVLTTNDVDDASQAGPLLDQLDAQLASFTGDGAYDQDSLYRAVTNRDPDALVIVPPRATAVPSETAETKPTQRDQHLQDIAAKGRIAWQKASGYTKRSRVETMIGRYKQVIGDGLRFHKDERRGTEVRVAVHVLNRMSKLGRPISVRIA